MTDDGQHVITIVHLGLRLRGNKSHCLILVENSLICKKCKKKEDISPVLLKAPIPIEKSKTQHDNTKTPPKIR